MHSVRTEPFQESQPIRVILDSRQSIEVNMINSLDNGDSRQLSEQVSGLGTLKGVVDARAFVHEKDSQGKCEELLKVLS